MTTPDEDLKVQFVQELIFSPDENGDAIRVLEFFDATKEHQAAMFESWVAEQEASRLANLVAQREALEARISELTQAG